jgi:hypothetical protein
LFLAHFCLFQKHKTVIVNSHPKNGGLVITDRESMIYAKRKKALKFPKTGIQPANITVD